MPPAQLLRPWHPQAPSVPYEAHPPGPRLILVAPEGAHPQGLRVPLYPQGGARTTLAIKSHPLGPRVILWGRGSSSWAGGPSIHPWRHQAYCRRRLVEPRLHSPTRGPESAKPTFADSTRAAPEAAPIIKAHRPRPFEPLPADTPRTLKMSSLPSSPLCTWGVIPPLAGDVLMLIRVLRADVACIAEAPCFDYRSAGPPGR